MNPIKKFESCAQTLWTAEIEPKEKAKRLHQLGETISHYLARVPDEAQPGTDPWKACAHHRSLDYLRSLANDVRKLADSALQAQ